MSKNKNAENMEKTEAVGPDKTKKKEFNEESAIIDAIVTELKLAYNSSKISSMTAKLKEKFPESGKALKGALSKVFS